MQAHPHTKCPGYTHEIVMIEAPHEQERLQHNHVTTARARVLTLKRMTPKTSEPKWEKLTQVLAPHESKDNAPCRRECTLQVLGEHHLTLPLDGTTRIIVFIRAGSLSTKRMNQDAAGSNRDLFCNNIVDFTYK